MASTGELFPAILAGCLVPIQLVRKATAAAGRQIHSGGGADCPSTVVATIVRIRGTIRPARP